MSLILEALRKSEAERQLGRAPGLMTPMPQAPHRRGWLRPLLLVLPVLLLAGVAGWWFGRGSAGGPTPAEQVPDALATQEMSSASPEPPPASDAPPAAAAATAATSESTAAPAAPPSSVEQVPAASVDLTTAEAAPPPAATAAPATSQPAAGAPPAAAESAAEPAATSVAAVAAAADPVPPPITVEPSATSESLPTLPMLEAALRDGLPPLRMSMHVYAEPVDQRFVLIDGRRYAEGQTIDQRLQIAEIRRDGVVLSVDGRRFLLPRS